MDTKLITQYLTCELSYEEFINNLNDDVLNYLDKGYQIAYKNGEISYENYRRSINFSSYYSHIQDIDSSFAKKSDLYDTVYLCMNSLGYNIPFYDKYSKLLSFSTVAIPEYCDSDEASEFIEKEIINKLPTDISDAKRIKLCKQKCKELFHIENKKYPHWVQSSEWPVRNNKPLKYIKRIKKDDLVVFVFEDVDTKEQVLIEQFY